MYIETLQGVVSYGSLHLPAFSGDRSLATYPKIRGGAMHKSSSENELELGKTRDREAMNLAPLRLGDAKPVVCGIGIVGISIRLGCSVTGDIVRHRQSVPGFGDVR
jgi:hypothetical protein